jgi:hypothetical protein
VVLEKMASHADVSIYVFEHDADEFPADAASGE